MTEAERKKKKEREQSGSTYQDNSATDLLNTVVQSVIDSSPSIDTSSCDSGGSFSCE